MIFGTDREMTMYDDLSSASQQDTEEKQDDYILIAYFLFTYFNEVSKPKERD